MKEINVKGNDTGIKVFINGVPDLTQIPKDITDTLITVLEFEISENTGKIFSEKINFVKKQ